MPQFQLYSPYEPKGDQPTAIAELIDGLGNNLKHQVLLGATGTGKTFTIANVIQEVQRPTLVIAHNKTLAAQLYSEFKEFFPHNAVEYFVSYYDYYQPEAYVPKHDLFIEKDMSINAEIERLRMASTAALMSRNDVIIVASVSCIYGLGSPEAYGRVIINLKVGESIRRNTLLRRLVEVHYARNDYELRPGVFRVRGDTLEIMPSYSNDIAYRIDFFGDEVERLLAVNPLTGELIDMYETLDIFPAKQFITEEEKLNEAIGDIERELAEQLAFFNSQGKLIEAQRLEMRTKYDLEMLREVGYCSGIENYSRHMDQRPPGTPPWTLVDYFPADFLLVIDESHMTIPQIGGMFGGDQSRKNVLVEYGFRLPSAIDNRPLSWSEFESRMGQVVYVSATPGPYELQHSQRTVEQIIRPTGLVDPQVILRPTKGQIDDLLSEVYQRVEIGERTLVTTLTKRMAEDLADYLQEAGVKVQYLHSEIDTVERVEILRDLRLGKYDVVVGINLLREGLDLPEVSLVTILDADKEGFLRSDRALLQTIGRAARHSHGTVIMYADKVTDSMRRAIDETERRRQIQLDYNEQHGIIPVSIVKAVYGLSDDIRQVAEPTAGYNVNVKLGEKFSKAELTQMISDIEEEMRLAAQALEFERAAELRDQMLGLKAQLETQRS